MKAILLEKPQSFSVIEVDEPAAPTAGEALVKVHRIGICGSDYSGYLGKMPFMQYPLIPGHELGVEVLSVGPDVTNVKPGDRCSVEPYMNCQQCNSCKAGRINCCEQLKVIGVMSNGGMCERIILPARKLHPANALSFEQCALVETLAIGLHSVKRGQAIAGEDVLVVGAGPIGLSVIEFVKLAGCRVIVMDMNENRLAFVREKMGIPDTIQLQPGGEAQAIEQLSALTNTRLAELVIDATGSNKSMSAALAYCSHGARLVYVGLTLQEVTFPHAPIMHKRELTLKASRNALPAEFTEIIALIEAGKINTRPWITHHARYDEVAEAFPKWMNPETGVIKAVLEMV